MGRFFGGMCGTVIQRSLDMSTAEELEIVFYHLVNIELD